MALKLYFRNENGIHVEVSNGSDFTSPIVTTHDGKLGGSQSVCLYLNNDDANLWYSNIEVLPVDLVGASPYGDVSYEETGWGIKLSFGSSEPTAAEWNNITWGRKISLSNIGSAGTPDTSTYYPFWYLVSCPPNTNAQNKSDIVLRMSYTENAI